MLSSRLVVLVSTLLSCLALNAHATDQTAPGAGNVRANQIAAGSPRVQDAHRFLVAQAQQIGDTKLRQATLNLLSKDRFCVTSRAGLSDADKARLLSQLQAAGLVEPSDDTTFPGGLKAGVFPPLLDEASTCPHLPMNFDAAPGSSFSSHHGYPGGLPVHEANNERAALGLAHGYRESYIADDRDHDEDHGWLKSAALLDKDVIIAAPIWHDWAKTMVFQWTADGQEFQELNFGGSKANGSATGGHHIISIAESIKRGLPAAFVIAQASAHAAPTLGNEFKVVNWIRAAAILAQVDPVQAGYLAQDASGTFYLPALRKLASSVDLHAAGQTNLLAEYTIHNLSDGDFTFSIPAASDAALLLAKLAPLFGFNPSDIANYNNKFRNPVFAHLSQERMLLTYANHGLDAVKAMLEELRVQGAF